MQMFDSGGYMNNKNAFEDLLKDSFLELDFDKPENEAMIQALSDSVMCSKSFQPAKSYSIRQLLSKISLQSILCVIAGLVISLLSIYLCTNQQPDKNVPAVGEKKVVPEIKKTGTYAGEKKKELEKPIDPFRKQTQPRGKAIAENVSDTTERLFLKNEIHPIPEKLETAMALPVKDSVVQAEKFEQPYIFPILTDKEIKANEKQKKKMSDQLVKLSKNVYPLIPLGSVTYKADTKTSGGFYMQNHEVTNLEYRTFLFDLLIQNRKEEFLIAKPEQSLWINSNNTHLFDHLKDLYFSDKAYNEYPVVNISVEGAKLYCKWINELLRSRADRKQDYNVKLPTEMEWVYAAKGGLKKGSYPWGTDSIQNKNNAFLANFNVQLLKEQFNQPFKYTTKFGNPLKLNYTACTSAGLVLNKDTVATVSVGEYNPNWYGLYCMSGNAAEWSVSEDGKLAKALGGSWGSDFEHLKITVENEYAEKKCSPFIGFRFIIVPIQE